MARTIPSGCKQTMFVGDRFLVKDGWCKVVNYDGKSKVTVKFDLTGSTSTGTTFEIRNGTITDPLIPSVYGVGFFGKDYHRGNPDKELYSLWAGILERCYSEEFKNNHPTYRDCITTEGWKDFSVFCKDISNMKRENGWDIDKDLLVKGNKIYGKEFCVFLPRDLNIHFMGVPKRDLPTGVHRKGKNFAAVIGVKNKSIHLGTFENISDAKACYDEFKKNRIIELAEEYKHSLDDRAYDKLINYFNKESNE